MRKAIYWVCLFQLIFVGAAWSQATTGSIVGRVTDTSHATIAGANVAAVSGQTGVSYPGQTDSEGNYVIYGLPPGTYNVTVQKDGFQSATISGVLLEIDQKQLLNFELKVGSVSEKVVVTTAATMLQTQSAETGEVIQSQDIVNLPLLGRTFTDLTALTAGVTPGAGGINSFNFSINGQREYANSVQIDGIESTTNRTQDITVTPSVDSVQEFKVATSAYSAEFGRAAGGVISVQTKAGTNDYHGTAYEFFRPNFTAAKSFGFGSTKVPPSTLKQHNYGGTLGGPVLKKKTFFFASFEKTHKTDAFDYVYQTLPKNQVKFLPDGSVDLSGLVDPFTGKQVPIYDPIVSLNCYGGCYKQFTGNIIPANRVSAAGVNAFNDFWPSPDLPGKDFGWFNNFQVHSPVHLDQKNADGRLDHNFSEKDRLYAVFHYSDGESLTTDPYWGHTVVVGGGDADQGNHETYGAQEYSITETHLFSTRFMNEARFGYTRYHQNQYSLLNGQDLSTKYGVGNINVPGYPATQGYPWIYMGSGTLVGGSTYKPYIVEDNNYQIGDNVILTQVGKHEIKFGGEFRHLTSHPNFSLFPTAFFYFGGPYAAMTADWSYTSPLTDFSAFYGNGGSDIADLLLGLPLDVQMGLQLTNPHTRSWEMHYYAQDTFRFTPRLTLNYGLRYEYQSPYTESNNGQANYDPISNSLLLAGRGGNSAALVNSRWNDFGPRLGIAYQITPKTVMRAGYGFYYSPENDAREDILTKNYPFATQQVFTSNPYNGPCSGSNCTGVFSYQMDAGVPRSTTIPIPAGASSIPAASIQNGSLESTYYVTPTLKTGYSQLYNFAMEREIGQNFTLEAAYVGSLSHDLSYKVGDINRKDPVTGVPAITPFLGHIQALNNGGYAKYNSLQFKATKRVSQNLTFLATYTYGHNLDNGPSPWNLGGNNDNPQDPRNLRPEYASADNDIRHTFVFSGTFRLPFGRGQALLNKSGWASDYVFGGWQLNGIFMAHTGTPVNVVRSTFVPGYEGLRPNLVGNPTLPRSQRTLDEYFNITAFDNTAFTGANQYALGNAGRNLIVGPGYVNADTSLFKEFPIKERARLETRFEVFNLSNTPHFANPVGDMSQPTFGHITRIYGNMRVVQIAGKFIF
jgi:hypothetical protein